MITEILSCLFTFFAPLGISVLAIRANERRRRQKQHQRRKWGSRPIDLQKRTLPDLRL
jgi:hypothetical protein